MALTFFLTTLGQTDYSLDANGLISVDIGSVQLGNGRRADNTIASATTLETPLSPPVSASVGASTTTTPYLEIDSPGTATSSVVFTDRRASAAYSWTELGVFNQAGQLIVYAKLDAAETRSKTANAIVQYTLPIRHGVGTAASVSVNISPVAQATTDVHGIAQLAAGNEAGASSNATRALTGAGFFALLNSLADATAASVLGNSRILVRDAANVWGITNLRNALSDVCPIIYDTAGNYTYMGNEGYTSAVVIFKGADGGDGGRSYIRSSYRTAGGSTGMLTTYGYGGNGKDGELDALTFNNISATAPLSIVIGSGGRRGGNATSSAGGARGAGGDPGGSDGSLGATLINYPDRGGGGGGAGGNTTIQQTGGPLRTAAGGHGGNGGLVPVTAIGLSIGDSANNAVFSFQAPGGGQAGTRRNGQDGLVIIYPC